MNAKKRTIVRAARKQAKPRHSRNEARLIREAKDLQTLIGMLDERLRCAQRKQELTERTARRTEEQLELTLSLLHIGTDQRIIVALAQDPEWRTNPLWSTDRGSEIKRRMQSAAFWKMIPGGGA